MIAIVLANFQAYQARNISTEYSESKWIAFSMVSILQAMMIGAPILILASTDPTASFIVWSMLIFVICMSILGLLFVPKMMSHKHGNSPESGFAPSASNFNYSGRSYANNNSFGNSGWSRSFNHTQPPTSRTSGVFNESRSFHGQSSNLPWWESSERQVHVHRPAGPGHMCRLLPFRSLCDRRWRA